MPDSVHVAYGADSSVQREWHCQSVGKHTSSVYASMVEPKSEEEQYNKWKLLIPYLYDWFANHNLTWPSLSCR